MGEVRNARPQSRARVIGAGIAGAYVVFAIFAQLIGSDESSENAEAEELRWGGFCSVLNAADYPMVLQILSAQDQVGRGFDFGQYDRLYSIVDQAPDEFQEEAGRLVDGLELAVGGQLEPSETAEYIQTYDQLIRDATPMCRDIDPYFGDPRARD